MIYQGDALTVLRTLPEASVDAIVCDPPYGLTSGRNGRSPATVGAVFKGFMGLEWDGDVPPVALWAELRRVAKPGANLLSFGATRRQHRLVRYDEASQITVQTCQIPGCVRVAGHQNFHCTIEAISKRRDAAEREDA